jgi:D-hydroxyproline dehydrogenase subunit gamma
LSDTITVRINGKDVRVKTGTSVAAAVVYAAETCRTSVTGQLRAPFCGMGICFECRMTIAGRPHTRACQVVCEHGMEIRSDE